MAGGQIGSALQRLRGLLGAQCAGGPTDGELLRRYVAQGDEAAFEALLRRHGPMVLGLCRRLLGTAQDVDDAFQATFLVLIRKAPSIGDGDRVGGWLYGVAYRVAVRARSRAARDRARHQPLTDLPGDEPGGGPSWDVLALLDEEVSRLPARYREAVVCCYLEGRTQEEAAHVLGWPKGTVSTRLNRARELLRSRLTRRGLTMTAGSVVVLLAQAKAEGALPPGMTGAVLKTLGQALANAPVPAGAAALADGVLRVAALGRLKAVATAALALAVVTAGGVASFGPGRHPTAPQCHPAVARARPAPAPSRDPRPARYEYESPQVPDRSVESAHVLAFTLSRDGGPADHDAPGTTVSVLDPTTGRVHASLKVPAGRKWRLAVLAGGRTLAMGKGVEGGFVALAFLAADCEAGCAGESAPCGCDCSRVKVQCWHVAPGELFKVTVPAEKPRV
jgi:RNA polymerase sigma factor (sigma-70 family)